MRRLQTVLLAALIASGVACGYGSKSNMAARPGVVPTIAQLAPTSTIAGGPGFMLTVNGTNFSNAAQVKWNGVARTTTFVSANQVMGAITAADIATPATVSVSVTNPGTPGGLYGGGTQPETSAPMDFTVN